MNYETCPPSVREGLKNYIEHRIPTGGFLNAVLCNNLSEAFGRADHINRECLFQIASWIYNEAPAACWGNPSKVEKWLANEQVKS